MSDYIYQEGTRGTSPTKGCKSGHDDVVVGGQVANARSKRISTSETIAYCHGARASIVKCHNFLVLVTIGHDDEYLLPISRESPPGSSTFLPSFASPEPTILELKRPHLANVDREEYQFDTLSCTASLRCDLRCTFSLHFPDDPTVTPSDSG